MQCVCEWGHDATRHHGTSSPALQAGNGGIETEEDEEAAREEAAAAALSAEVASSSDLVSSLRGTYMSQHWRDTPRASHSEDDSGSQCAHALHPMAREQARQHAAGVET